MRNLGFIPGSYCYKTLSIDPFGKIVQVELHNNEIGYNTYLNNVLKNEENQGIIHRLLILSPYLFFSNEKELIELDEKNYNLRSDNFSIHDKERFLSIMNFRFDYFKINTQLKEIQKSEFSSLDLTSFWSSLFINMYKYSFVEISESIYWRNEKERIEDYNFIKLLDLIQICDDYIKNNKLDYFNHKNVKDYKSNLNKSISNNNTIAVQTITELKKYLNKSRLSKVLYSIIAKSIKLSNDLTSTKRNRLLRPLFNEIVIRICYPDDYEEYKTNKQALVVRYSNFLKTY